jgi:uncharacterized protein with GYD domain
MSTYVVLLSLTDAGRGNLNATLAGTDAVLRQNVEANGGTLTALHWTLGAYDAVVVADIPDELAPGFSAWLSTELGATTTTLRASSSDDLLEGLNRWRGPDTSGLGP